MKLKQLLDSRAFNSLAALGLLLGVAAPAAIPAFASAAQLSSRSITMSTSATSAAGVSYDLKFTGVADINTSGGIVIDFCSNSAVTGDSCTRPTNLKTAGSALGETGDQSLGVTGVKYNGLAAAGNGTVASSTDGRVIWTAGDDYTGGDSFELTLTNVTNPSVAGVFYARITTYTDSTALATSTSPTVVGTYSDEGSIALAATAGVGITSYVLESMSFCVSGGNVGNTNSGEDDLNVAHAAPSENCGAGHTCPADGDGCVFAPSMTLGQQIGTTGQFALDNSHISTGQIYAQLSSNATGNTVVNLKSDAANCGGLYLNGSHNASDCHIAPKNAAGSFTAGQAFFGLKVGTPAAALDVSGNPDSANTGTVAPLGNYLTNASDFYIGGDNTNNTGVTSPYGDSLFQATGAVNNMNVPITFGTSISNTTPAGVYGATLSLIAVGTF